MTVLTVTVGYVENTYQMQKWLTMVAQPGQWNTVVSWILPSISIQFCATEILLWYLCQFVNYFVIQWIITGLRGLIHSMLYIVSELVNVPQVKKTPMWEMVPVKTSICCIFIMFP
jgi:hypothetical protein